MHNSSICCVWKRFPKSAKIVPFSKGIVQLFSEIVQLYREIVQLSGEIAQLTRNWQEWLIVPTAGIIIADILRHTFPILPSIEKIT